MPKIKSFEEACKALNIEPNLPNVEGLPEAHAKAIVAHYKLVIIAQAMNEGWKPDWTDRTQAKYYPWFKMSGSGLSCHDYGDDGSDSGVGSRLCFKDYETAKYAGQEFEALYAEYFILG